MGGREVEAGDGEGAHAVLAGAVDDVVVAVLGEGENEIVLRHARDRNRSHPEVAVV